MRYPELQLDRSFVGGPIKKGVQFAHPSSYALLDSLDSFGDSFT